MDLELAVLGIAKRYTNKRIVFLSDSQADFEALDPDQISFKLGYQVLNTIACYNSVNISWVLGHSGIHSNDRAEETVKQGPNLHCLGLEPACGIT